MTAVAVGYDRETIGRVVVEDRFTLDGGKVADVTGVAFSRYLPETSILAVVTSRAIHAVGQVGLCCPVKEINMGGAYKTV